MIQSLQTNNVQLVDRINTIKNQKLPEKINTNKIDINLAYKTESISKSTKKLSERIHTVEFDNQNLLKCYDRLADRVFLQDGNLHTIQVMFKNGMLSLKEKLQALESHVQNEDQRQGASMKSLEIYTGQEIQALQKTIIKKI